MIRVSIVEDDRPIRSALKEMINECDGLSCIGNYGDCEGALKDLLKNKPDVMLMDIELPGISGIEGVKIIKQKFPKVDVIMLTVHEDLSLVFKALSAGASGYLDKSASEEKIIESIKEIYEEAQRIDSIFMVFHLAERLQKVLNITPNMPPRLFVEAVIADYYSIHA